MSSKQNAVLICEALYIYIPCGEIITKQSLYIPYCALTLVIRGCIILVFYISKVAKIGKLYPYAICGTIILLAALSNQFHLSVNPICGVTHSSQAETALLSSKDFLDL